MKKYLNIIVAVLCLVACVIALVACNNECAEHVDDNGDALCDECGESIEHQIPIVEDENNQEWNMYIDSPLFLDSYNRCIGGGGSIVFFAGHLEEGGGSQRCRGGVFA